MTKTPTFVTYHSTNAAPGNEWIAYINGWQVRCVGSTEDEAKERALNLWNKERARMEGQLEAGDKPVKHDSGSNWGGYKAPSYSSTSNPEENKIRTDHGNAGKVWMRHPTHGLKRVSAAEAGGLGEGWYKSGPRGK